MPAGPIQKEDDGNSSESRIPMTRAISISSTPALIIAPRRVFEEEPKGRRQRPRR